MEAKGIGFRVIITGLVLFALLYLPSPAFSQQTANIQNLIRNGDFEEDFPAELGLGRGWSNFNNGSALIGWNAETWAQVVPERQQAQMIEIKNSRERDRYAGIYQTITVVPNQQYRLSLKGLIRSSEGEVTRSNYGYRLQYALDHQGGTTWELLPDEAWRELPWDEQPLAQTPTDRYRIDTFNTTITSQSDSLTLFIRGWKKWIDSGTGIYDLDDISLIGPIPDRPAPVAEPQVSSGAAMVPAEAGSDQLANPVEAEKSASVPAESGQPNLALPVSGQGPAESLNVIMIAGATLLLLLLISAGVGLSRRRSLSSSNWPSKE
jgi:hypothetical protein